MKVPNPAVQIPPQPNAQRLPLPQRRLDAADLADLAPPAQAAKPAAEPQALAAPAQQVDARPVRPGTHLDIKV